MYVLMIDRDDDYDGPDVHGPFADVTVAQRYARAWREGNGVPGHDNDVPTPEENQAWTDLGWSFAIVEPRLELGDEIFSTKPEALPPQTSYNEALVVFRNLLDIEPDWGSEYVMGGVNLIADLFGIVECDVGTRMDQVEADLRRIPMFANPDDLARYGVAEYVHDPPSFPPQKIMRCADEPDWPERTFDRQGDGPDYCCSHCGWAQESFGGGLYELCWSASWHSAASYGLFAEEATRQGCKDVPAWPLNIEPDTAPPARLRSYRFPHSDPEETP